MTWAHILETSAVCEVQLPLQPAELSLQARRAVAPPVCEQGSLLCKGYNEATWHIKGSVTSWAEGVSPPAWREVAPPLEEGGSRPAWTEGHLLHRG